MFEDSLTSPAQCCIRFRRISSDAAALSASGSMTSVVFASPLKAASPLAQSVYDPAAIARPILKRDDVPAPFAHSALVLPAAPPARPTPKLAWKTPPLPSRADPRFNPVKIAKSEASLNTRMFLQTKPHAGDAVVGAQRFLALNRDSELRHFKRQLADTAPVAVAIGYSQSFADYLQDDLGGSSAADEASGDDFRDLGADAEEELSGDDVARRANLSVDEPQYPLDQHDDNCFDDNDVEYSSSSSDCEAEFDALLSASCATDHPPPSHSAASETDSLSAASETDSHSAASETHSLASGHPAAVTDANVDYTFPSAKTPEMRVHPARASAAASPSPVPRIDMSSKADMKKDTPTSYSALYAARVSPPAAAAAAAANVSSISKANSSSNSKAASRPQALGDAIADAAAKASRSSLTIAPPPSFAELSKYSQQMVSELANTQQMEAHSSARIAQRDLLHLRDSFQRVASADRSTKHLSTTIPLRLASKPQASSSISHSRHLSHLNEPTPPRSRRPVPNSVVSKPSSIISNPVRSTNVGLYDIDDADVSAPSALSAAAAVTPKQHRATSISLPSVSPFFRTPERPGMIGSLNIASSSLSSLQIPLQIPLPAVDSVPCTPRPSTPPQPIQSRSSFENEFLSFIPRHNHAMPTQEQVTFIDLDTPQAPPYPDIFVDRGVHNSPSAATVVHRELPRFETLFELTNDRDHDVFAAISALSAPLESLVAPQSRFSPRIWLSVIDTDADIYVRIQRMKAACLVLGSLVQKDEDEVKCSFKRLNELRVDLLWQTKRRQLRFWLNSSGHIVLGHRKKEVVMRFLGLTPASKHAKNISIKEPSPGCPGVSVEKRWQGSDFKIQLMLSLVSKYQLHLAFVQFKMNAARARAVRHISACLSMSNARRYILLGWSSFKSWHFSKTRTRAVAIRSGSNKWFFFLQVALRSWYAFVSSRIKRQRSVSQFQQSVDSGMTSKFFKGWSSSVKIRKHGNVLASAACQFWYLTCSLRCILRWWQGAQNLVARKHALRAFAGSNSGSAEVDGKLVSGEGSSRSRSLSKAELDEQLRLKRALAIRRRKQLLTPLKM